MNEQIVEDLRQVDLFSGLSPKVLRRIAGQGSERDYPPGHHVTSQGESVAGFRPLSPEGVSFHIVLGGTAQVLVAGERRADLVPGQYFGELSLIDGAPRSADVIAGDEGLRTFALDKYAFQGLLEELPEIAVPMLSVMVARLRRAEA